MKTEHKFEVVQFSRRTEIEILKSDEDKLIKGFNDLSIRFKIKESGNSITFTSRIRLDRTEVLFLKGRIIPRLPKYKPKSKVKPIYDKSIVVGITIEGYLIYKRIN